MKLYGIVTLFCLWGLFPCHAETVDLINTEGRKITVELVRATDEKVWFQMKGRRETIAYDLSKLDQESNELIKKWLDDGGAVSKEFEVSVITGKSNRMNSGGDVDDREYKIQPTLKIKNESRELETPVGKATLVFFGKPVLYRGKTCVVNRQEFDLPAVEPLQEIELKGKLAEFKYDEVENGEVFGARYRGYAVILKDAKENVIYSKSIPSSIMEAGEEKILSLKVAEVYDKYWEPTGDKKVRLR